MLVELARYGPHEVTIVTNLVEHPVPRPLAMSTVVAHQIYACECFPTPRQVSISQEPIGTTLQWCGLSQWNVDMVTRILHTREPLGVPWKPFHCELIHRKHLKFLSGGVHCAQSRTRDGRGCQKSSQGESKSKGALEGFPVCAFNYLESLSKSLP